MAQVRSRQNVRNALRLGRAPSLSYPRSYLHNSSPISPSSLSFGEHFAYTATHLAPKPLDRATSPAPIRQSRDLRPVLPRTSLFIRAISPGPVNYNPNKVSTLRRHMSFNPQDYALRSREEPKDQNSSRRNSTNFSTSSRNIIDLTTDRRPLDARYQVNSVKPSLTPSSISCKTTAAQLAGYRRTQFFKAASRRSSSLMTRFIPKDNNRDEVTLSITVQPPSKVQVLKTSGCIEDYNVDKFNKVRGKWKDNYNFEREIRRSDSFDENNIKKKKDNVIYNPAFEFNQYYDPKVHDLVRETELNQNEYKEVEDSNYEEDYSKTTHLYDDNNSLSEHISLGSPSGTESLSSSLVYSSEEVF